VEARVFHIEEKVKASDLDLARPSDFRTRPGPAVDARIIIEQPQITLYALDDEHRQALFVEAPPDVDVTEQPFLFRAQYLNAQRLLTVPYETLHQLAAVMGDRFRILIPMYSVGRCGGTLLSRALNRLNTVLSLDEPDVYNQIVVMRPPDGSRDAELVQLLRSCTRLLHKPFRTGVDTLFLKFRPPSMEAGDLMYKAFPDSRAMFLYRNAEDWARSASRSIHSLRQNQPNAPAEGEDPMAGFLNRLDPCGPVERTSAGTAHARAPEQDPKVAERCSPLLPAYIRRTVKQKLSGGEKLKVLSLAFAQRLPVLRNHCRTPLEYLKPHIRAIPPMKLLTLIWLSPMHRYLALHALGIPILAVQYETLVAAPEAALRAIFEYCGLPVEMAAVAEGAFAEDSQKDTPLAWQRVKSGKGDPLTPEILAQLREVLREHPPIQTPDFVVPNSLNLRQGEKVGR
jgi:hypothetical protein